MKFPFHTVRYADDTLYILDQTKLPSEEVELALETPEEVIDAIKKLKVRGAPAIGVAAAYALLSCMRRWVLQNERDTASARSARPEDAFFDELKRLAAAFAAARPTAVNLSRALSRMVRTAENFRSAASAADFTAERVLAHLQEEADAIQKEDAAACAAMGAYGLTLLKPGTGILTHCNAGALATTGIGTALAPLYAGKEKGIDFQVFVDETRPLLQGARLTAWELSRAGIPVTLIADNMASAAMQQGKIRAVLTGCDRMAANGDGANKIGTSALAVLAQAYGIPFYMFVPTSTIDLQTRTGKDIPIELRDEEELSVLWYARPMAPAGVPAWNPAFDVTPARYITAVITEKGIVYPPYEENLSKALL